GAGHRFSDRDRLLLRGTRPAAAGGGTGANQGHIRRPARHRHLRQPLDQRHLGGRRPWRGRRSRRAPSLLRPGGAPHRAADHRHHRAAGDLDDVDPALGAGAPGARRRRRSERPATPSRATGAGSPTIAIARKDWLGFRRDVRRLTRLLPALLLPLGYAVALSQLSRSLSGFWSNVGLVTFLSMFMSSALASP